MEAKNIKFTVLLFVLSVFELLVMSENVPTTRKGRVMIYAPLISRSMRMTFMPLAHELVKRGHEVVVVNPYREKGEENADPNLKVVTFHSDFEHLMNEFSKTALQPGGSTSVPFGRILDNAIANADAALSTPEMKSYLSDPSTKFDVLITPTWPPSETGFYLAHRFNASLVLYCTLQNSMPFHDLAFGQPHNPAYMPVLFLDYKPPFSFLQRVKNTLATAFFQYFLRDFRILRRQEEVLSKHFDSSDPDRPSISDLEKRVALGLHFGHPLLMDGLRPTMPNFQFIGMMNCRQAVKENIKGKVRDFVEGAKEGVIFVSFGTAVRASEMDDEKRKMFLRVFGKLKQRVLWKWETGSMPDAPPNLMVSEWFPQQDLLAHPNVKLFISHGGQSSFQETLCHQKPVLVIPVAGDQHGNGREAEHLGVGRSIAFHDANEDNLSDAIRDLIEDESYAASARETGALLWDQETAPLWRAAWWVEFLVRHPGVGERMRSPARDMGWPQYFLVDVVAFLLAVFLVAVVVLWKLLRWACCGRRSHGKVKTK